MSKDLDTVDQVRQALSIQHPVHSLFAEVFEEMGGKVFLKEWAEDNPGRFITLLTRMTPTMAPQSMTPTDIKITINNQLGPTPLDIEHES